jgi:hypothetical protein
MSMLRKIILVLSAVAALGLAVPSGASARGGFGGGAHGGGFGGAHGGGFGGFHGGGFRGGGFRGGGYGPGFALGALGFGLGYGLYGPYGYGYGYPYYAYDNYGGGGCYVVRQRVHTPYGWRVRPVEVCD